MRKKEYKTILSQTCKYIFRAILNSVALNRLAHVLWSAYICLHVGEIPGKGIARSYIHTSVELS